MSLRPDIVNKFNTSFAELMASGAGLAYCSHDQKYLTSTDKEILSREIQGFFTSIFDSLSKTALTGKLSATHQCSIAREQALVVHLAFKIFTDFLNIQVQYNKHKNPISIFDREANRHTIICNDSSPEVIFSWEFNNPYLHPKPILVFPKPAPWGFKKLLEERRSGTGPDLISIKFGETEVRIHSFILKEFSAYFSSFKNFKERDEKLIQLPEVTYLSKEVLEDVADYMYSQELDLTKHSHHTLIHLLQFSNFLTADHLRFIVIDRLNMIAEHLDDRDCLLLLFTAQQFPCEQLEKISSWILSAKANFYISILADEIEVEELNMLFSVCNQHNIKDLKNKLKEAWENLAAEAKINFIRYSLHNPNQPAIELIQQIGKKMPVSKNNPLFNEYLVEFKTLSDTALDFWIRSQKNSL